MWIIGLQTLVVSAVATWVATSLVVRLAHRVGAVDLPGPRKIHAAPVPRIGGLAVFIGFVAGLIFAAFATGYLANTEIPRVGYWTALGLAAIGMLLLGIVDDVRPLAFQWKFAAQIVAGCAVWAAGFRVEAIAWPFTNGSLELGLWSLPLTVLWIVGITNAFNLIDGLDGLAAGTALITTTTVAILAVYGGHVAVSAISVALAGSLAGFLRHNFNPARIFLGDSGSLFLGFTLAVISIHGSQKNVTAVAVLAPLLVMGYPILDTALSVARRLNYLREDSVQQGGLLYIARNVRRVFLPDRGHVHHRLLELGLSHRGAVLALYLCAAALAAGALVIVIVNSLALALVLAGTLALLTIAFFAFVLVRARSARRRRVPPVDVSPPTSAGRLASGGAPGRN